MRRAALGGVLALLACAAGRAASAPSCAPPATPLAVPRGQICVERAAALTAQEPLLREWIARSAAIVAQYYGRFPAPQLRLVLGAMTGSGIGGGRTESEPDLHIEVRIGTEASRESLQSDWVLVHEMVHLALPEVGRRHNWLAEGLATYVEGIARVQAGNRSAADFWAEARHSMPAGLARSGEGGLDETRSWGRTYWGGALFCLQADMAIRTATHNRRSLQDALRAILGASGGYANERSIEAVLGSGDAATGTTVLTELYRHAGMAPQAMDLDTLWRSLGVPEDALHMPFDEHAPQAELRRALTQPAVR
jgi:hypothetical protein